MNQAFRSVTFEGDGRIGRLICTEPVVVVVVVVVAYIPIAFVIVVAIIDRLVWNTHCIN